MSIEHVFAVARRKLGVGDEYQWCDISVLGEHDYLVGLGRPTRRYTSGKKKGQLDWRKVPILKCAVTREEMLAEEERYERETGCCHECDGEMFVSVGWNQLEGHMKRPCKRCNGTGMAPGRSADPAPAPKPEKEQQLNLFASGVTND